MVGKADVPGEALLAAAAAAAEAHPVRAADLGPWDPNALPPPAGSLPPPLAHGLFGPPTDSPWGAAVLALPSELLAPYAPATAAPPAAGAQTPHPARRSAAAPPPPPAYSHRGGGFVVAHNTTPQAKPRDGAPPPAHARPRGAAAPPPPPPGPLPPTEPGAARAALDRRLDAILHEDQTGGTKRRSAPPSGAASTAGGDTEAEYTYVERAFTPEAAHHATDPQPEAARPGADDAPPPRREHWVVAVFRSAPYNPLRTLRSNAWQRAPAPPTADPGAFRPGTPPGLLARFRLLGALAPPPPSTPGAHGAAGSQGYAPPPIVALDPASVGAPPTTAAVAAAVGRPQATVLRFAALDPPAQPSAEQALAQALPTPEEQANAWALTQVFRDGRWQPLAAVLHARQPGPRDQ